MTKRKVLITYQVQVVKDIDLEDYEDLDTYEDAIREDIEGMNEGAMTVEECLAADLADDFRIELVQVRVQEGA